MLLKNFKMGRLSKWVLNDPKKILIRERKRFNIRREEHEAKHRG